MLIDQYRYYLNYYITYYNFIYIEYGICLLPGVVFFPFFILIHKFIRY